MINLPLGPLGNSVFQIVLETGDARRVQRTIGSRQ